MIDLGEIRNTIDQDITALPAPFVVPQGVLLLAWWEDEPLGCVALGALDASTGEVKRMYVRAVARGRGIGAALLDALLGHARALGHARVRLDTAPELTPAIALYERFGFRPIAPYRESQCLAALYLERSVTMWTSRLDDRCARSGGGAARCHEAVNHQGLDRGTS